MKRVLVFLVVALGCVNGRGATLYVDGDNRSPVAPYTNWATAADSIQDAIDASVDGDVVLVTNGTYFTGYTTWGSDLRTRVVVSNVITVRSVNGPEVTTIRGLGPSGPTAVRCVYLASNAVLSGFTLQDGHTRLTGDFETEQCGGGMWSKHYAGIVSNCYLVDCAANEGGGGARGGLLYDSVITNCQAKNGGATYNALLTRCQVLNCRALNGIGGGICGGTVEYCLVQGNCSELSDGGGMYGGVANYTTFRRNEASYKGGAACGVWLRSCAFIENSAVLGGAVADVPFYDPPVYDSTFIRNRAKVGGASSMINIMRSILIENEASSQDDNVSWGWATYCVIPEQYLDYDYNVAENPLLAGVDNPHLLAASPVIDYMYVTNKYTPYDIDGELRINGGNIDAGCDEFWATGMTGMLSAVVSLYETDVSAEFSARFEGTVYGKPDTIWWNWGDGQVTSNLCMASHCYTSPGDYDVVFGGSNLDGETAATVSVHVVSIFTNYVSLTGNHTPPFSSWATAATTIQDAVDAQLYPGGIVMVADGIYTVGQTVAVGECPNRVALTNQVVLRSANGPSSCVIQGVGPLGTDAVRGLYVGNDSVVDGITIERGHSRADGSEYADMRGGGVYCERHALLTNCVIRSCMAAKYGGGVHGGTVCDSVIVSNEVIPTALGCGGGAANAFLFNCTLSHNQALNGGGAGQCKGALNTIFDNRANKGGGAFGCTFRQTFLRRNIAYEKGGGVGYGALENCVVVENKAAEGGGAASAELLNCIVYYNQATVDAQDWLDNPDAPHSVYNSCLPVVPLKGTDNVTNEPGLCGLNNPHILADSVCRNSGTNRNWMVAAADIDGESRLEGSFVDIGCDEYHASGVTGPVSVAVGLGAQRVVTGYALTFEALTTGRIQRLEWDFDDGSAVVTNQFLLDHAFTVQGAYDVVLSAYYDGGFESCTAAVEVIGGFTNYVSRTGLNVSPYATWASAARNIQDAVAANGVAGGMVMVRPGTYDAGGSVHWGGLITSRVVLAAGMKLVSSDGPETTIIEGVTNQGPAAVRCVYLGDEAFMSGFTLREGGTSIAGGWLDDCSGAGVLGQLGTVVSNCWIQNCNARQYGGGAALSSLVDCRLTGNTASNGAGIYYGTLAGCVLQSNVVEYDGGATYGTVATVCTMEYNRAITYGGAMMYGSAEDCVLNENWVAGYGGGAYRASLVGCSLFSNFSYNVAGGSCEGTSSNCVYLQNGTMGHGGAGYGGSYYDCSFIANTGGVAGVGDYMRVFNSELISNRANVAGALFYGHAEGCTFKGNAARLIGGAVYGSTNRNCWFTGNYAANEGGAGINSLFENCTIVSNSTGDIAGGLQQSECINCIVRYNYSSAIEDNYANTLFDHSFTYPMPSTGSNNSTEEPGIVGWNNPRLLSNSPCINAGTVTNWMTNAVDIDGAARIHDGVVDVGCSEFYAISRTGTLAVAVLMKPTRVIAGNPVSFTALIDGQPLALDWDFGGMASEDLLFSPSQTFGSEGTHQIVLQVWNEDGMTSVTSQLYVAGGFTNYVAPGGGNVSPFTNWAMAAHSLQDAITANDVAGGVVMVSNGVYDSERIEVTNGMGNRVVVTNPVMLRSVNGPEVTVIKGRGPNGVMGIRGVYMISGAELHGFTVTNGHTHLVGDVETELRGGGVWCEDNTVLISNCVISGCGASSRGGGVYRGTVKNSSLCGNDVVWYGGAAGMADLVDCVVADNSADLGGGGAMYEGTAKRCAIRSNRALGDNGGGTYNASLYNCLVYSNEGAWGGGIYRGVAYQCTIVSNRARTTAGGTYDARIYNSIVYYNRAAGGAQNVENGIFGSIRYSCATPLQSGEGNITNSPLFVNLGAFDLQIVTNSSCIDAGGIEFQTMEDYACVPRPLDGNDDGVALPDMGAYEVINNAADSDGDTYIDGDEFVAGTDPVDPDSYFAMLAPVISADDIIMQWQTTLGRLYTVMSSTNLSEDTWVNVPGYVDLPGDGALLIITNTMGMGACEFYRIEVEEL